MHGVKEDFGATISAVFEEANPTMPYTMASRLPLFRLPDFSIPGISRGYASNSHSMETIAVIALLEPGIWPLPRSIANERQPLIQIVLRIASHAPLWSTTGFLLPIPA